MKAKAARIIRRLAAATGKSEHKLKRAYNRIPHDKKAAALAAVKGNL